ncbi:efflux RND transporter periplasmic adaptor subunit [Terrimonas alba]|uniref:efflux RND transporter periplasmic adaptor subunit n=1 Tax=Terrimonas alba TaxID=3349636 RepID=UPI0035F24D9E
MRIIFIVIAFSVLFAACKNKKIAADPDVYYTCSMDPQVISDRPGKCPICKMELTAVKKNSVKQTDDLQLSDQQIQLGNIQTDTIASANMGDDIVLLGTLNLNGMKTSSVSARTMGRVEKLYVKNVGDYVAKGSPLYELYSEELNNAKQEYILALQRRKLFTEQSVIDFETIIQAARNKLRLWGMSEQQVKDLENQQQSAATTTFYSSESGYVTAVDITEGSYIMEGGTIIQLADLSTLWAEAQVYATQHSQIPRGGKATVQIPDAGVELTGKIEFANPEISPDSRINLVRITVPNQGNKLKPGMPVYVRVNTSNKYGLSLPTDAVIRERKGATVWLKTGDNTFRSQMVTTGIESDGIVEITQGLKQGDIVVVSGAYLLHSEFIFKRGTDPMAGHSH